MKLLLMAYECSPYRGSEWAVGWGRLLQAARIANSEIHIITSESNHAALTRARAENLLPANVHIHTPTPDAKLRRLEQKPALFAYNYTAYHHWQRLAFPLAQALHAQHTFALVHQVNVCTFREPGYTWQLPIPYLWGPVGGSQNFPTRFLSILPPIEAVKELARAISNWLSLHAKPRVRHAARAAARIVAANSTNQRDYTRAFSREVALLLETGLHTVTPPDRTRFEHRTPGQPLQILWSGELQTRKALPLLLRALAKLPPTVPFTLHILGDGPMRDRWQAETARLGLADRVTFLGRLPFAEAVAQMHTADLFVFTSLRDTSGNVILEALAAGVPVLCFDHQGAGDMVTPTAGIKLPVTTPAHAIAGLAAAITLLAADPARLLALSYGATARARDFLWDRNGDIINQMYADLAADTSFMPRIPGRK